MSHDFPISELRVVRVYMKGSTSPHVHYMHESQVDVFVEATVNLHYLVGNPHNGKQLHNLWRIEVSPLSVETDSFWWCSPTLHADQVSGARLNSTYLCASVWRHPDLIAEDKRCEELDD